MYFIDRMDSNSWQAPGSFGWRRRVSSNTRKADWFFPAERKTTLDQITETETKIALDKFYVAKYPDGAVQQVCKQEYKGLMKEGWVDLNGNKYNWAIRSRLTPIKTVARIIKKHLCGILSALLLQVSNGLQRGR